MWPQVARSVSPVEILDLNYIARDAPTSEDWETVVSSTFSSATETSPYPVATGSFGPQVQLSPMANNGVISTSSYTLVAGSIPLKATPWLATSTPSQAQAPPEMTLNEINGASDIFMDMYKDMPGLSTSPLSSTSTAGLNTPVTDNNAVDDILRNMGLPDWVVSGDYNEFDALGFLADPNKDVGGGGGLPADAPHALEALPGPLSSPAADVAGHEPDRHDVDATLVEAPALSSVPHATSSSSRSRANYSHGAKTIPGAPIVLAHSDAADNVDNHNHDHDHEHAAAPTVKRPRKKRAQRGTAEAAQFAPAEDPCANDEALARQLEHEFSLPRTRRSSGSSASSTKRKRNGAEVDDVLTVTQNVILDRPVRGKRSRTSKRAVAPPNPLATAVSDFDVVMSDDDQPLASTSRTPIPSRAIKAFPSRSVKRTAAVPASSYDLDSDMGDDNVIASSSRLPKSTDDDDDEFVCPSDADDSADDDWTLRPKGSQKRKIGSKASAGRSKKRVRATAPESDAEEEIDEVQEDPNEPVPGVKVLEQRYGIYVTSADLRQRKADVKVPGDLCCRTCNKILADDDSYRRHMVATLQHQPAGYNYYPHMCNLCGDDSVRRDSLLRHVFHLHKGTKKTKSARVARMLKEHDALWTTRAVNSRISRRVCAEE